MKKESFWSPPLFGYQYWMVYNSRSKDWHFQNKNIEIIICKTSTGNLMGLFIGTTLFRVVGQDVVEVFKNLEAQILNEQIRKLRGLKNLVKIFRKTHQSLDMYNVYGVRSVERYINGMWKHRSNYGLPRVVKVSK